MKKKLLLMFFSLLLVSCAAPAQQKTEITLVAAEFEYEPSSITVPAGRPVMLTIKNKGTVEHDFVIEKISMKDMVLEQDSGMNMDMGHDMNSMHYDLHVATMGGKTSVVTFTPLSAGTYQFLCTVKGHKEAGMTGVLVVTE